MKRLEITLSMPSNNGERDWDLKALFWLAIALGAILRPATLNHILIESQD